MQLLVPMCVRLFPAPLASLVVPVSQSANNLVVCRCSRRASSIANPGPCGLIGTSRTKALSGAAGGASSSLTIGTMAS